MNDLPERVWLPDGVIMLAAVSPELQNVEGSWWMREGIIPMLLWCPECGVRHIDEGDFATKKHHTHACQNCGHCWRPAIVATCGVRFLPGFKNDDVQNETVQ